MISGKFQKFYNGLLEWFVAGLPETKDTYGVRYDKARDMMEEGLKEFILATIKEAQETTTSTASQQYVVEGKITSDENGRVDVYSEGATTTLFDVLLSLIDYEHGGTPKVRVTVEVLE